MKVVIVGHSGVGKTSIISRYVNQSQDLSSIEPTLGAVYHQKTHQMKNGQRITFQIWDTAGQQRYRSIAKIYYKDAKVVLAVYDTTCMTSFEELKHWIGQVKTHSHRNTKLILVGNKIDLVESQRVPIQMAKQYSDFIVAPLRLTSAIDNKGIKELFELVGERGSEAASENQRADQEKKIKIERKKKQQEKQKKKCCL